MNSKTIVVIALSSLFMTAPYAASQENASIEVSYTASTANFRQGGNSRPNRYILLANASTAVPMPTIANSTHL